MDKNILFTLLFTLAGLFSIVASVMNWDFFFNNYRARFFVKVFGRQGARVFYAILGVIIIVLGVLSYSQV